MKSIIFSLDFYISGGKSGHRRSVSGYDASRSSISPSPAKENLENGYRFENIHLTASN